MPLKFSYIFILIFSVGLLIGSAWLMSYAYEEKSVILERRQFEYLAIEHLRELDPPEYSRRVWDIHSNYESQLSINILQKEAGAWGAGILGILLFTLGILDSRLYRRRLSLYQKGILVMLVENHIDSLIRKRDNEIFTDKQGNRNNDKWEFEKTVFIENVMIKEETGRLLFSIKELSGMIDEIIEGTLK